MAGKNKHVFPPVKVKIHLQDSPEGNQSIDISERLWRLWIQCLQTCFSITKHRRRKHALNYLQYQRGIHVRGLNVNRHRQRENTSVCLEHIQLDDTLTRSLVCIFCHNRLRFLRQQLQIKNCLDRFCAVTHLRDSIMYESPCSFQEAESGLQFHFKNTAVWSSNGMK